MVQIVREILALRSAVSAHLLWLFRYVTVDGDDDGAGDEYDGTDWFDNSIEMMSDITFLNDVKSLLLLLTIRAKFTVFL